MLLLVEDLALLCLLSADALYFKNEDDNVHILVFVFGLATSITSTLSPTTFSNIYLLRLAQLVQPFRIWALLFLLVLRFVAT
jgi:hypothetical protein